MRIKVRGTHSSSCGIPPSSTGGRNLSFQNVIGGCPAPLSVNGGAALWVAFTGNCEDLPENDRRRTVYHHVSAVSLAIETPAGTTIRLSDFR